MKQEELVETYLQSFPELRYGDRKLPLRIIRDIAEVNGDLNEQVEEFLDKLVNPDMYPDYGSLRAASVSVRKAKPELNCDPVDQVKGQTKRFKYAQRHMEVLTRNQNQN